MIVGERFELAQLQLLKRNNRALFLPFLGIFLAGLSLSLWLFDFGVRIAGIGIAAMALASEL